MDDRTSTRVQWLRATVVASLAVFLGVAGHVTADGLLPGIATLLLITLFAVPATVPLLGRRLSSLRVVAALVGGQTAIHLALSMTAGHRGDPTAGPVATRGGAAPLDVLPTLQGRRVGSLLDAHDAAADVTQTVAPAVPAGHLVADLTAHAPMMLAHLLAAVGVALWLAHGERLLRGLAVLLGRRVTVGAVPLLVVPGRRGPVPARIRFTHPRPRWRVAPLARRGPPLVLL